MKHYCAPVRPVCVSSTFWFSVALFSEAFFQSPPFWTGASLPRYFK